MCQKFLINACIKRIDDEKTVKDSTSNKIVILYSVSTWINNMRTLGGTMDDSQLLGIYRFTFSNNIRLQMIYYKSNDDTSNMVNGTTQISYFIVIWVILSIFMSSLIDLLIEKNWYKYVQLSMHQLFTLSGSLNIKQHVAGFIVHMINFMDGHHSQATINIADINTIHVDQVSIFHKLLIIRLDSIVDIKRIHHKQYRSNTLRIKYIIKYLLNIL